MKWSFASVALVVLGLTGVAVIMLFQQITTNNENDYYLLKEVTESAMIDAIDIPYYRETGNLKIVTEKFIENFTRRFAESTIFASSNYKINFYDIMETPPKVSVIIDTGLGQYTIHSNSDDYSVANKLDAILEYSGKNTNVSINDSAYGRPYVSKKLTIQYYAIVSKASGSDYFEEYYSLKIPTDLNDPNIRNISIDSVGYVNDVIDTQGELNEALLQRELVFNVSTSTNYMQTINNYGTNVNGIQFDSHNCGRSNSQFSCDNKNKYWIYVNGNTSDVNYDKLIFKYEVVWSYEEYEY